MRSEENTSQFETRPRFKPLINNFIQDVNDGGSKQDRDWDDSVFTGETRSKAIASRRDTKISSTKTLSETKKSSSRTGAEDSNLKRHQRVSRTSSGDKNGNQNECSGSESDSDNEDSKKAGATRPQQAWLMFEKSIKRIDENTQRVAKKISRKNFKSSDTFNQVMVDLFGNTEYSKRPGRNAKFREKANAVRKTTSLASRLLAKVHEKEKQQTNEERKDEVDNVSKENGEMVLPDRCVETAKRGWTILKRHVQDTSMENKTNESTMKWKILQHQMKNMNNEDRARLDLYQRYGVVPVQQKDGTFVAKNSMLSERAQNALLQTDSKRPKSERPVQNKRDSTVSEYLGKGVKKERPKTSGRLATRGVFSNHDLL